MMIVAGLFLLALGLFSGGFLVASALGFAAAAEARMTLWLLFPAFTLGGYLLAALPTTMTFLPLVTRLSAVLLMLLALVCAAGLVLRSAGVLPAGGDNLTLWYVLGVGLVLGAVGLATAAKRQAS